MHSYFPRILSLLKFSDRSRPRTSGGGQPNPSGKMGSSNNDNNKNKKGAAKRASTALGPSPMDVVPSKRMMLGDASSTATPSVTSVSDAASPAARTVNSTPATSVQSSPSRHGRSDNEVDITAGMEGRFVRIPDLFSSIMSVEPVMNVHYAKVKKEADAWIKEVYNMDEVKAKKSAKADLAYMVAIWGPTADEEATRMMVDWQHWVFAFDDQFDEGHLKDDPVKAQEELDATYAILEDKNPPVTREENPIRYVFQTTWDRLKKRASPELQERWKSSHRKYFAGLIGQVKTEHSKATFNLTVDEYMNFRRATIGTDPSFALVEYGQGINISQEQIDHESLRVCERVSADLVILVNDILSYRKDLELGVDHNLISLLKAQGYSDQGAVDKIGDMIEACYKSWYGALARMPVWGEKIDREVLKYVDGCRNIALGNVHWSYQSGRYLGSEGPQTRQTGILRLPPA